MGKVELSELDRVNEAMLDVKFEMWPTWGRTRLLCNPEIASKVCRAVRSRTGLEWSDENILLTLFPAKERPRRRT